jgi:16S rRNA processing protein RimM
MIPDDLIQIGTFTAPHGLHGAIKLRAIGQPDALLELRRIYIPNKGWLGVKQIVLHDVIPVLMVAGVNSRADALTLHSLEVYAEKNKVHLEPDTFYYHDLIGRAVVAPDGSSLGVVQSMIDTGVQDILVVRHNGREVLVPLQAPYVRVLEDSLEIEPISGLFDES